MNREEIIGEYWRYWVLGTEISEMVQFFMMARATLPKKVSTWDDSKDIQILRNQGSIYIDVEDSKKANMSKRRGENSETSVKGISKLRSYDVIRRWE